MSLFFLQLRGELWKLFARKRTYLGFGAFVGIELLVLLFFQLPPGQHWFKRQIEGNGQVFSDYFSGLTIAMIMLSASLFFLGALFLALVSGDLVAKEVEDGTMRMTLCRPVSRFRVLLVKYVVCVVYTFSLVFFVGFSALSVALAIKGFGGLFIIDPQQNLLAIFNFRGGLLRYLGALPFDALCLLTISTFAFQLSCWNIKPVTATIGAIMVFFVDWVLHFMPYFEPYRRWMLATVMNTPLNIFRSPIPWPRMVEDYSYLLALDATFLIVGFAVFSSRDFKS